MKKLGVLFGLLITLVWCLFLILRNDDSGISKLEIYCAAGLQKPVEEIAQQYEEEYGVKIMLNFGGSGQLLTKLALAGGDLYLPVDVSYIDKASEKGLVSDSIPVSKLTACIIVAEGNPKKIKTLQDLARDDVKVVLAEYSAGIGELSHAALEDADLLEAIENGIISKVGTVNEVALQVDLGSSDAGIVWDVIMPMFKQSEFVRVPDFDEQHAKVQATVGVIKSSENRCEALRFAHYLTPKDKGGKIFKKYGFDALVVEK